MSAGTAASSHRYANLMLSVADKRRSGGADSTLCRKAVTAVATIATCSSLRAHDAPASPEPVTHARVEFCSRIAIRRRRIDMDAPVTSTQPDVGSVNQALMRCIGECSDCALVCVGCADACLAENSVENLRRCIRLSLDCADACAATASIATRRAGSNHEVIHSMLRACATACRLCADECARHGSEHGHCAICADSCRRCQQACEDAAATMQ